MRSRLKQPPNRVILRRNVEMFGKMFSSHGCRQIWIRNDKAYKEAFFCKSDKLVDNLDGYGVLKNRDYYITRNPMYADKRGAACLVCLDNIVLDIDVNEHSNNNTVYVNQEIDKLFYYLENDYYNSTFPAPTLTVRTGHGVQMWFSINSLAITLEWLYRGVTKGLCDRMSDILRDNDIDLSVDYIASCNPAGLVRVPYTYNTHGGTLIDKVNYTQKSYDIDDLVSEFDLPRTVPKPPSPKKDKLADEQDSNIYTPLHRKRIEFLEEYVDRHNGNVTGVRNQLCFFYYNAAVQIYDRATAETKLRKLSSRFSDKYSEAELRTVIKGVNKKIYHISNATFADRLGLGEADLLVYNNTSSRKSAKTVKEDKAARNMKILKMATDLHTCEEIAEAVDCSVRTVKSVLKDKQYCKSDFTSMQVKEMRKTMTVKQVANRLGISVSTVQRLQREH